MSPPAPCMNVIDIIADQHQAACLGCAGHNQVITPNLDRMAASGVRFTDAYTQNPICTPSRVSILSGQYPHNHGYYGLSGPRPVSLPSYLSHFRAHGYRTAGIGNLHTPCTPRNWLEDHVDLFDDSFQSIDGKNEDTAWYARIRQKGLLEKEDFHHWWLHPENFLEGMPSQITFEDSQEGWCVERAIRFMEQCRAEGRPFCMQVSLERPHQPFYPDRRFWEMYPDDLDLPPGLDQPPDGRPPHFQAMFRSFHESQGTLEPRTFKAMARRIWHGYLACITHVDHAVGLLLDYLETSGLAAETAVLYHADHGGYSGTHGIPEKAPGICSDAVCRIPFIFRVPGVTRPGAECNQLVENVDIAPTIAEACGLPAMATVDGKSIFSLLRGKAEPVRDIAVTEHPWSRALRWRNWRFVHYQREMFGGEDIGELYDLEKDPDETHNLYSDPENQAIVQECRRLLLEWLIRTTRVVTVWPPVMMGPPEDAWAYDFATAEDGKEANTAGPALRVARGQLEYI